MEKKQFLFELKELKETGEFEGYAAIFGNLDKGGDIIEAGAFTKTLLEKKEFPLSWMHDIRDLLGIASAEQDDVGLKVHGFLNMAVQSAKEKYALVKQRAVRELSIGYDTVKAIFENNNSVRRLQEVKLYEVALVPWAMNPEAQIINVKMEGKPYPSEHACRLQDPKKYDRFTRGERKHKGKTYSIIFGWRKKDGEDVSEEQAYRYDKDTWTADEAKAHCKDHEGTFEAASGKSIQDSLSEIISWKDACCISFDDEQRGLATKAVESLNALLNPEPEKPTQKGGEPRDKQAKPDGHLVSIGEEFAKIHSILGGKH
jgi:uncharacterized protein